MSNENSALIFAQNLRERRLGLNMTQRELAERLCYSEKSVSKWESGSVIAPSSILLSLAEALSCEVGDLLRASGEPEYFLGVDGGGTKTDFMLSDANGSILASVRLGASNPVDIGIEATEEVLTEGIRTICRACSSSRISAFVGLAGGITGNNREKISRILERFRFRRFDNGSDSQNAVAAALGDEDGTAIIAGTGTIAYVRENGVLRRIGGFGYLFEDGGSGYSLGREAIYLALRAEEGTRPATPLTELVKSALGGSVISRLSDIYEGGKRFIASFAPLVFEAIDLGDESASLFLAKTAQEIAAYLTVGRKTPETRAVLLGGLTAREDLLKDAIAIALAPAVCDISICKTPPVYGALRLAGLKNTVKENLSC